VGGVVALGGAVVGPGGWAWSGGEMDTGLDPIMSVNCADI
jgi:hypothetical protein